MSKKEAKTTQSLSELRAELSEAKRSHRLGNLTNTARLRELRAQIARALTAEKSADKKVEE